MKNSDEFLAKYKPKEGNKTASGFLESYMTEDQRKELVNKRLNQVEEVDSNLFDQFTDTFSMGLAPKIRSGIAAGVARPFVEDRSLAELYRDAFEGQRKGSDEFQRENPISTATAQVGGALLGGAGLAGLKGVRALASLASRGGVPGAIGAGGLAGETAQRVYEAGMAPIGKEGEALLSPGISMGGVLGSLGPAAGASARALAPSINDAIKPLIRRAEEFNIPLRLDQATDGRLAKTYQKISQAIPGSGASKFEDLQKSQWQKALVKTLGVKGDDLSPTVIKEFRKKNNESFRKALGDKVINVDESEVNKFLDLKELVDESYGLTDRDAQIFKKDIEKIITDLGSGKVSGEKLSNIRSNILKTASKPSAPPLYSDVIERIDDLAMQVGDADLLKEARKNYRNFKTIEPIIDEAGNVTPNKLYQRVKSNRFIDQTSKEIGEDDLVDLARVGRFIKTQGGSDTFEKSALTGGFLTGGGYAVDPTLGLITGGSILGNAGLQRGLMQNQALLGRLSRAPSNLPVAAPMTRAIRGGGQLGTLSGSIQQ